MKRLIALLFVLALLLASLTSCRYRGFNDSRHPSNQPMTKWGAEGIELYVLGPDQRSFMIVDCNGKKMTYFVTYGYGQIVVDDVHPLYYKLETGEVEKGLITITLWNISLKTETKFKLYDGVIDVPGGGYDIPELMFAEELDFVRIATNLTEEDIPKIKIDEQYGLFCPKYRPVTQWISDDQQMTMDRRICQLTSDPDTQFYINFFESNSSAYLTKITDENKRDDTSSLVSQSTEEWKCEYFEDYFLATVVRSEYYEPGHVLTFTLLPPSTESETGSTTELATEESRQS